MGVWVFCFSLLFFACVRLGFYVFDLSVLFLLLFVVDFFYFLCGVLCVCVCTCVGKGGRGCAVHFDIVTAFYFWIKVTLTVTCRRDY